MATSSRISDCLTIDGTYPQPSPIRHIPCIISTSLPGKRGRHSKDKLPESRSEFTADGASSADTSTPAPKKRSRAIGSGSKQDSPRKISPTLSDRKLMASLRRFKKGNGKSAKNLFKGHSSTQGVSGTQLPTNRHLPNPHASAMTVVQDPRGPSTMPPMRSNPYGSIASPQLMQPSLPRVSPMPYPFVGINPTEQRGLQFNFHHHQPPSGMLPYAVGAFRTHVSKAYGRDGANGFPTQAIQLCACDTVRTIMREAPAIHNEGVVVPQTTEGTRLRDTR